MSDLAVMKQLLTDISDLMRSSSKADKRLAVDKLNQLAAIATTLAFTIRQQR